MSLLVLQVGKLEVATEVLFVTRPADWPEVLNMQSKLGKSKVKITGGGCSHSEL